VLVPRQRWKLARGEGFAMALFGIGVVVGPVLGGWLTEDYTGVMYSISTDRSGSSAFLA
jgi:hypothetical protein